MSDLNLYYSQTVNKVKGEYCYIMGENSGRGQLLCRPLKGGRVFLASKDDVENLNNKVIGLVNTPRGMINVFRRPVRCAKEGVSSNNIDGRMGGFPWESYPYEFCDMLDGIYPTVEEARRMTSEIGNHVAISPTEYVSAIDKEVYNIYGCKVRRKHHVLVRQRKQSASTKKTKRFEGF